MYINQRDSFYGLCSLPFVEVLLRVCPDHCREHNLLRCGRKAFVFQFDNKKIASSRIYDGGRFYIIILEFIGTVKNILNYEVIFC